MAESGAAVLTANAVTEAVEAVEDPSAAEDPAATLSAPAEARLRALSPKALHRTLRSYAVEMRGLRKKTASVEKGKENDRDQRRLRQLVHLRDGCIPFIIRLIQPLDTGIDPKLLERLRDCGVEI